MLKLKTVGPKLCFGLTVFNLLRIEKFLVACYLISMIDLSTDHLISSSLHYNGHNESRLRVPSLEAPITFKSRYSWECVPFNVLI
jgi:hypothetical protein